MEVEVDVEDRASSIATVASWVPKDFASIRSVFPFGRVVRLHRRSKMCVIPWPAKNKVTGR